MKKQRKCVVCGRVFECDSSCTLECNQCLECGLLTCVKTGSLKFTLHFYLESLRSCRKKPRAIELMKGILAAFREIGKL